jgi:hypothetical protein
MRGCADDEALSGETDPMAIDYGVGGFLEMRVGLGRTVKCAFGGCD